jgi:hypothetical protein
MVYRMGGALTSLPLIIRLFRQAPSPPRDFAYRGLTVDVGPENARRGRWPVG